MAFDAHMAADGGAAVVLAEFEEVGIVGDARDDLLHVDRALVVHGHHAQQFLGVVARRLEAARRCRFARPVDLRQDLARDADGVAVVLGQVVAQARDVGVHLGAAQLFFGGHLAGGGHQQRRAGQEGPRAAAHHDDVVRQPGLVGAAGGGRAVRDGHHRQPGGRHARQVAEQAAAAHEVLHAVGHEVGARAFHQLHEGQPVLQRQFLHAQLLVQAHGLQRTGVDARVGRADHAAHARHGADAGDRCRRRARCGPGRAVQPQPGQRAQFQERRAGVQQQRQAFARQQLAALLEACARRGRLVGRAPFIGAHTLDQRQHAAAVGGEGLAAGREPGFDLGHGRQA
jgi:hypothetical protein